jgi:NAD(P)-dependent dehydrogenase (short-subunit alcohol dehydrogenase family)
MGELDGKVAVITGAGSGMGKASVGVFLREGAQGVIAADISGAEQDTATEHGSTVIPVHCDVRDEDDVIAAMDAAVQNFGRLDAVLNVAGVVGAMPMLEVTRRDYDHHLDVDLRGVFLGTTCGIRAMLKTGRGGSIVNWSSLAGLSAWPGAACIRQRSTG